MTNPVMTITMKNGRAIKIELFPKVTPNSVNSIISLIKKKMYDKRPIYRIVKDFVLQTGCENTKEFSTGCDYIIDGEYKASGYENQQPKFTKGIVGMAGLGGNSNVSDGSSFFIITGEYPNLDGNFAVIGTVIDGMEEVERLNNVAVDDKMYKTIPIYQPLVPEIMENVTVETFGIEYKEPITKPFNEPYIKMEEELQAIRRGE